MRLSSNTNNKLKSPASSILNSTDIIYSKFRKEDLFEICRALNFPDIKYVTTATLIPERNFYHCCLNVIQTYMKIKHFDEIQRGLAIADMADLIFNAGIEPFRKAISDGKLTEMPLSLDEKRKILNCFINRMVLSQMHQEWSIEIFDAMWRTNRYRYNYQTEAIDTYRLVNEGISSRKYIPSNGWNAEKITRFWSERNLEYKHYREIGSKIARKIFNKYIPKSERLTYFTTPKRKGIIIFGPMGCGKSNFSKKYLEQLSTDEKNNMVHHDADYLKLALSRSAMRDGVIQVSNGSEVQNESSNALYEAVLHRHYEAATNGKGPNVIVNSICANSLEIDEILEGGGHLELHHISIDINKTIAACKARAKIIGRNPSKDNIGWSNVASAKSLLSLTKYIGSNIALFIHERDIGAPHLVGVIDFRSKVITVYNMVAFKRVGSRANLGVDSYQSGELFYKSLLDNGFFINKAILRNWMISSDDPVREEIASLAKSLGITNPLRSASNYLGKVKLKDGRVVRAHIIHAVDAILTNGEYLVMIRRKNAPGIGKLALPGGFLDPSDDEKGVETPMQGALREVLEEAFHGLQVSFSTSKLVGKRNVNRPFDVRVAQGDSLKKKYGVLDGDIFTVSTQAVVFDFPQIDTAKLVAGDDALLGSACKVRIDSLVKEEIGIKDHFDMIVEAFPEKFQKEHVISNFTMSKM